MIVGMDILVPLKAVIDLEERRLVIRDKEGKKVKLQLLTKDEIKHSKQIKEFKEWRKKNKQE